VLEEIIRQCNPKEIVVSALGVREGLIYSQLSPEEQAGDPLILSAREFNQLRSRAPDHGDELYAWTSRLIESTHLEEDGQDRRLRHAACLLSDISWRAHPDYRGVQAYDLVVNAAFIGVDHPSRAFLALAASYRHMSSEDLVSPQSRALVTARQLDRARILGAAMRVAYNISAAMPGVLPRAPMVCGKGRVILTLPADLAPLSGERLLSRMRQFGRLVGAEPEIRTSV
jgi:exopolyphosphatase/guanosine-5'-triphosphate,3'-diphosphate pyrophosphatase